MTLSNNISAPVISIDKALNIVTDQASMRKDIEFLKENLEKLDKKIEKSFNDIDANFEKVDKDLKERFSEINNSISTQNRFLFIIGIIVVGAAIAYSVFK